jgi:DNA (cytosine-5)-methyltransferase 1
MVTHSLRADGFDASEDGTGRRTPLVPVTFHNRQDPDMNGDVTHPLGAKNNGMAVAFDVTGTGPGVRTGARETDVHTALRGRTPGVSEGSTTTFISSAMQVRRLTPRECERLQGFPDDYTLIPYRGKPAADGPRYKALGNSMAVPCMVWIGKRIAIVERISRACNLRGPGFGRR